MRREEANKRANNGGGEKMGGCRAGEQTKESEQGRRRGRRYFFALLFHDDHTKGGMRADANTIEQVAASVSFCSLLLAPPSSKQYSKQRGEEGRGGGQWQYFFALFWFLFCLLNKTDNK